MKYYIKKVMYMAVTFIFLFLLIILVSIFASDSKLANEAIEYLDNEYIKKNLPIPNTLPEKYNKKISYARRTDNEYHISYRSSLFTVMRYSSASRVHYID